MSLCPVVTVVGHLKAAAVPSDICILHLGAFSICEAQRGVNATLAWCEASDTKRPNLIKLLLSLALIITPTLATHAFARDFGVALPIAPDIAHE